jgi:hypothetical protein
MGSVEESAGRHGRGLKVLLWSARIPGGLFVAILAFVIVVNFVAPSDEPLPTGTEWFAIAMFPFGVFVAYALAFRWELAGGVLALVCLLGWWAYVGFTGYILLVSALVGIPGILYVVYDLLTRRSSQMNRDGAKVI